MYIDMYSLCVVLLYHKIDSVPKVANYVDLDKGMPWHVWEHKVDGSTKQYPCNQTPNLQ